MASLVRASWNWLKMAWATQPVLFVSCVLGTAGPLIVLFGPGTEEWEREIRNWPTHYRRPSKQKTTEETS